MLPNYEWPIRLGITPKYFPSIKGLTSLSGRRAKVIPNKVLGRSQADCLSTFRREPRLFFNLVLLRTTPKFP